MKFFLAIAFALVTNHIFSQANIAPFIRLTSPNKTTLVVKSSRQFIIGATCKECTLTINNKPVKVYPTGAFAYEVNLMPGDSIFTLLAASGNKSLSKKITYTFTPALPPEPVKTLGIESIKTLPEGNLVLKPGDKIQFRVKALTNCIVTTVNNTVLYELPVNQTNGMPGIYQGEYIIKESDSFMVKRMPVTITDSAGSTITKETYNNFSVISSLASDVAITKGRLAHLEYGLGEDRLGGAKIGYIDSNIVLKIIGKVGTHFKVQLSKTNTAYIPEELVELMPKGISKGNALLELMELKGYKPTEVAVIGDSMNDITMLQVTPYSFAMSHSDKIVKESSHYIVKSVAEAIEIVLKINKESE